MVHERGIVMREFHQVRLGFSYIIRSMCTSCVLILLGAIYSFTPSSAKAASPCGSASQTFAPCNADGGGGNTSDSGSLGEVVVTSTPLPDPPPDWVFVLPDLDLDFKTASQTPTTIIAITSQ